MTSSQSLIGQSDQVDSEDAETESEESVILVLAWNGHHQNLLVIRPKSIINSLLCI
jgi:hypothetical protein